MSVFSTKLDLSLSEKLKADLTSQGFTFTEPGYTLFSAKKKGVNCTLYKSGKLVVQGKEMAAFIEFYLEPEILKEFSFSYKTINVDKTARIGVDESGKGDFFGPLCIAAVFAEGADVEKLINIGAVDSKTLTDKRALTLSKEIKAHFPHHILRLNPHKYNELYEKFGNLNHLLAWCHSSTIESLVKKTSCNRVIIDQFAHESVVIKALKNRQLNIDLTQRTKAESDPVVAAASIIARATFLEGLAELSKTYGITLPKGASARVIAAGRELVRRDGIDKLPYVCKMHFKTLDAIR